MASAYRSDVRRDTFSQLLHHLELVGVLDERQVAARHELDRDGYLTPDFEQRLHQLVGRARSR
jgi:hypothetical protein